MNLDPERWSSTWSSPHRAGLSVRVGFQVLGTSCRAAHFVKIKISGACSVSLLTNNQNSRDSVGGDFKDTAESVAPNLAAKRLVGHFVIQCLLFILLVWSSKQSHEFKSILTVLYINPSTGY